MKKKMLAGCSLTLLVCFTVAGGFCYLLVHRTPGAYFDANGVRLYYTVEGEGAPVILVHGVAATADLNWRRPGVVRRLARHYRVVTFDLRGHGLSGRPVDPEQYGVQMTEDIVRLMDHLGFQKAHVAGYSLGGFLVLKLLTLHPDRVQSAAICAAGWKNPEDPSPIPNPYKAPPLEVTAPQQASMLLGMASGSKSLFHRVRSWIGDQLIDKNAKKALKSKYMELGVSREALKKIQVPAICMIGTRDGFLPLARELHAEAPAMELIEIAGATHFTLPFRGAFKSSLEDFFGRFPITGR